jgi:hypothetical protein
MHAVRTQRLLALDMIVVRWRCAVCYGQRVKISRAACTAGVAIERTSHVAVRSAALLCLIISVQCSSQ